VAEQAISSIGYLSNSWWASCYSTD